MSSRKLNIAVIGAGISGIVAAHELSKNHQVTVFEKNHYIGGHTDTHDIHIDGRDFAIDTGFIVYNEPNYPGFCDFINQLGVKGRDTQMSFSVHNTSSQLEYNATDLNRLFCQRKNIINPRFYKMLWDLTRFYRQSPELLASKDNTLTLGDYLTNNNYSDSFINDHIIPMACALWSGPSVSITDFPARYFVQFMKNHKMLSLGERPQWKTIQGGSNSYVSAWKKQFTGTIFLGAAIERIVPKNTGVDVIVDDTTMSFDAVYLAVHSDEALALIEQPTNDERDILGGIAYQKNTIHLHSDTSILPSNPLAWAAWNARVDPDLQDNCTVSYSMNILQGITADTEFIVSLNCGELLDSDKIFIQREYSHPVYNQSTLISQSRRDEINGKRGIYYCGAYWGWGFHEDGVQSALSAVKALQSPNLAGDTHHAA